MIGSRQLLREPYAYLLVGEALVLHQPIRLDHVLYLEAIQRFVLLQLSDDCLDTVIGIGTEDLFYDETRPQPQEDVEYRLEQLAEFRARGKTVLVTDYLRLKAAAQGEQFSAAVHAPTAALQAQRPSARRASQCLEEVPMELRWQASPFGLSFALRLYSGR